MDWLKGMNSVVRYIEENLTQPMEYETMARIVGCSIYEFSRIFSFMTGMSVSEYVRRRRLSQAVFDIQHGNAKIIDIALKYCYESPAAFTRAFKDMHGTAPLSARKSGMPLKNYPAIKFILSIKGVSEMNFKIVEKPAFSVIGIKHTFRSNYDGDENQIPALWQATPQDMLDKLKSLAKDEAAGLFGMFTRHYLGTNEYLIAIESDAELPDGWSRADKSNPHSHWGATYPCDAVFVKHKVAESKWVVVENAADGNDLDQRVHTELLPGSGYSRAQRSFPTMEFYGAPQPDGTAFDQLWVPVDSAADITRKFEEAKAELAKIEAMKPRCNPVDIDLATMIPDEAAVRDGLQVHYTSDGKMVAFAPTSGNGLVGTPQSFAAPLKIEMRAKTDSTNLRIYYGRSQSNYWGAWVHFNGAGNDGEFYDDENLWLNDLAVENEHYHENATRVPVDEFLDLEWILCETVMAVKVNGEVRVASCEYEYIEAFKDGFSVNSPVFPAPGRGSTITVERLRVTEL